MKRIKTLFALLSLALVFACQTNDEIIDQSPLQEADLQEINSSLEIEETGSNLGTLGTTSSQGSDVFSGLGLLGEGPLDETPSMAISIEYDPAHNRPQIRQIFGTALGLISHQICTNDPDREIWVIPVVTQAQFVNLLATADLNTPLYSGTGGTAGDGTGGDDGPTGTIDYQIIPSSHPESGFTQFFFTDICQ